MYVYFIQSGDSKKRNPVKIGVARNPERRLAALQTGNPEELKLLVVIECDSRTEAYAIESHLHKTLAKRNIRGEWFYACMRRINKAMIKWETNKSTESRI
jgi:predicted GIY-YIG superfamily endonuclease